MNMLEIIAKKRDKQELNEAEIKYFIDGYCKGMVPDYQASSLLMAIFLNGMTEEETFYLTKAMLYSGEVVDLSEIKGIKADKHSTGGVGDKVSLVLGPIIASFGIKLAKMSGRGLGHTGGTLDKLESIPGLSINISSEDFFKQVNEVGIAIIGQTKNLVPADKLLYALRDVTATVNSIPLIASSIMSKKLASGADIIVLDVKVGSGAFMKTIEDATKLAEEMVKIGKNFNKKVSCIITDMEEPLGYAIGNNLEVIEAINALNGNAPKDLMDVSVEIASIILTEAKLFNSKKEASLAIYEKINNKEALNKLIDLVKYQHGDISYILDPSKFNKSKIIYELKAINEGYINEIKALTLGEASMLMGAGRMKKEDSINPNVGIVLNKKVNDYVKVDDVLCYLHMDSLNNDVINKVMEGFVISNSKKEKLTIYKEVN